MALLNCNFKSQSLRLAAEVDIIMPETEPPVDGFKTLWLLHGLSDDHTAWRRYTSIERYVNGLDLAVIMPAVNRSFYCNAKAGGNYYWDYISDELPAAMRRFFKLSAKREDNFVAGLSMGGYGAFKLALNYPDKFIFAGSFSGALDNSIFDRDVQERESVFGSHDEMKKDGCDLIYIVNNINDGSKYPQLYQSCGTEDFLYDSNKAFLSAARQASLDIEYIEETGDHNWDFWDKHIEIFIEKIKGRK